MFVYNILCISKRTSFVPVEGIPLCLKYKNKNKIYIYVFNRTQQWFITLVAASFGRYDHRQANVTRKFKRFVTCNAQKYQVEWDSIYINVNIC